MITGWPSKQSNLDADRSYVERGYLKKMFEFFNHQSLMQIDLDINVLPIDAEILHIERLALSECPSNGSSENVGTHQQEVLIEGVELEKGDVANRMCLKF